MLSSRKTKKRSINTGNMASSNNITPILLIVTKFMETLLIVKLFHWNTLSYAQHKSTDDFYSKLNDNMDKFIEVLIGKSGQRIKMRSCSVTNIPASKREFVAYIKTFRQFLINEIDLRKFGEDTGDLTNIRDEILTDLSTLNYLFTLK